MMEWLYSIGEWTFAFGSTWWGNLIWTIWMFLNFALFVVNMFYPLVNAFSGGEDKDLLYNPILVLVCQLIVFILVLWVGSLLYY